MISDVEAYLAKLNRRFRAISEAPGTFLIEGKPPTPSIAMRVDPPLVVMRVYVGEVPKHNEAKLFRRLLELNAEALVHTSYGLEKNRIVLMSALELENLDLNELEATLDEIDLALVEHLPKLRELS